LLNDPERYPEGRIRYQLPGASVGELAVKKHLTTAEFLNYLSLGLAAVGLVFAPEFGIVEVEVISQVAFAGSSLVMGVGAAADLYSHWKHDDLGVLTVVLDLAQVAASFAGGSAGVSRIIQEVKGASEVTKFYVTMTKASKAANRLYLAVYSLDVAAKINEILHSRASSEEQDRAILRLLGQFAATGALSALQVEGMRLRRR